MINFMDSKFLQKKLRHKNLIPSVESILMSLTNVNRMMFLSNQIVHAKEKGMNIVNRITKYFISESSQKCY